MQRRRFCTAEQVVVMAKTGVSSDGAVRCQRSHARIGAPAASEADTLQLWTNKPSYGCAPAKSEFASLPRPLVNFGG